MKLWLVTQCCENGYDTYDSAVVAASSKKKAKELHPQRDVPRDKVECEHIGEAVKGTRSGLVLGSFNAG